MFGAHPHGTKIDLPGSPDNFFQDFDAMVYGIVKNRVDKFKCIRPVSVIDVFQLIYHLQGSSQPEMMAFHELTIRTVDAAMAAASFGLNEIAASHLAVGLKIYPFGQIRSYEA